MIPLPDTDVTETLARAEAMRVAVEAIGVCYGEKSLRRVTISLRVAVGPQHGTLPQDLMRVADDALYDAKGRGRNQVVLADAKRRTDDAVVAAPADLASRPEVEATANPARIAAA